MAGNENQNLPLTNAVRRPSAEPKTVSTILKRSLVGFVVVNLNNVRGEGRERASMN